MPTDGTREHGGGEGPEVTAAVPASTGAADVFISYASADKTAADSICSALERSGIICWIAPRDVTPGVFYADAIVEAINHSRILIVVLSTHSAGSQHVLREVERASSKRKPVIAFRLDTTPLPTGLEYFLSASHWLDASGGRIEPMLPGLAAAVRRLLGEPDKVAAGASSMKRGAPSSGRKPSSRRLLWSGAAAATVLLLVLAGRAWLSTANVWFSRSAVETVVPAVSAARPVSDKSVAVLPFADMSEKKDQEYFADGIAEEVLDRLAQVPGLKVVGRASSFQFKGKNTDPGDIGAALGVAYLLEGSVRKEAGRARVAAQLVDARTGAQRWSDHFDSDVVDLLKVQDTIATEIAHALQIAVEVDTASRASVKSPESLDAYLRGLQAYARANRESIESGVVDFQQALAFDPTFAPAAMGLARCYMLLGFQAWLPTKLAFERAREAVLLAQRLDPKSPAPHVLMAEIHATYDWDWAGADRELQAALALGPRNSGWSRAASQRAAAIGQWDEARQFAVESVALDPLDPDAHMLRGWRVLLCTGEFAEAEQSFRRGLQIAPRFGSGQYFLGVALLLQGHHEAALAEFRQETLDDGQLEGSAMAQFAAGNKRESDALLAEAVRRNGISWPSEIARVYAFRGERDRAFEWLNRAYDLRDEDLYIIKGDPLFRNLAPDPRFKAFLRKMNLPE